MRDYRLHIGLLVGAMSMLLMGFNRAPGIMEFNTSSQPWQPPVFLPDWDVVGFSIKEMYRKIVDPQLSHPIS